MLQVFDGFKKFIIRGNAIDLAVGVVIGAAFSSVVNAIVKGLLTPFIGAIAKVPDFSAMFFTINGSKFMYGELINAIIAFLLVAFCIYFFVVLPMNTLNSKLHKGPENPTTKPCKECLNNIPVGARRCGFCGQLVK